MFNFIFLFNNFTLFLLEKVVFPHKKNKHKSLHAKTVTRKKKHYFFPFPFFLPLPFSLFFFAAFAFAALVASALITFFSLKARKCACMRVAAWCKYLIINNNSNILFYFIYNQFLSEIKRKL